MWKFIPFSFEHLLCFTGGSQCYPKFILWI